MDAVGTVRKLSVTIEGEKQFEKLSPFELKDELFNSPKNYQFLRNGDDSWIAC